MRGDPVKAIQSYSKLIKPKWGPLFFPERQLVTRMNAQSHWLAVLRTATIPESRRLKATKGEIFLEPMQTKTPSNSGCLFGGGG